MVSIIVACSQNNVIGKSGTLPWRQSADLRRFKALTSGHSLVMGRKTYESIPKPLPDRTSIVITRNPVAFSEKHKQAKLELPQGTSVVVAYTFVGALAQALDEGGRVFIVGGGEIYEQALSAGIVSEIYLTRIACTLDGDTFFPELTDAWQLVEESSFSADDKNEYAYTFQHYILPNGGGLKS